MPKAMERKLKAIAKKRGYGKERAGAFIYGTMRHKTGWVPSHQKKSSVRGKKPGQVLGGL